jgi:hypothetical protein
MAKLESAPFEKFQLFKNQLKFMCAGFRITPYPDSDEFGRHNSGMCIERQSLSAIIIIAIHPLLRSTH